MRTNDKGEMVLVHPDDVPWERVSWIQVKRYDVERRLQLTGQGPLKSLPLLGTMRRFSVEVVHKDDTWDRTHWVESPVEAHREANAMAAARGLDVKVVP